MVNATSVPIIKRTKLKRLTLLSIWSTSNTTTRICPKWLLQSNPIVPTLWKFLKVLDWTDLEVTLCTTIGVVQKEKIQKNLPKISSPIGSTISISTWIEFLGWRKKWSNIWNENCPNWKYLWNKVKLSFLTYLRHIYFHMLTRPFHFSNIA